MENRHSDIPHYQASNINFDFDMSILDDFEVSQIIGASSDSIVDTSTVDTSTTTSTVASEKRTAASILFKHDLFSERDASNTEKFTRCNICS